MAYIYFSEQEKEAANATDIADYLTTHGEVVKRVGREKVWHSPSGKVSLNGSVWYSQYEQTGGGAINFVRKYFGKSFPEAVRDLLGQSAGTEVIPREVMPKSEEKVEFVVPEKHTDMRRVYGYLLNERCLDRDVIHAFAHAGLIYEEPEYHNAVFLGTDGEGIARHAQKRSTVPASDFKNNVAGSNADYSFHWNGTSDRLYVFEAPIDMLAYISMHQNGWQEHSYVALCSTADRAALRMLRDHDNLKNIYLCLDHDSAGIEGAYRIADNIRTLGKDYNLWRVYPTNKDWDEDLKAIHGKEPIPSEKHPKLEDFLRICREAEAELTDADNSSIKGEKRKQYRLDHLPAVVHSYLSRAENSSPRESIQCYKNAGKAVVLYLNANNDLQNIPKIMEKVRSAYKPHKDYDSTERLSESLTNALSAIEQKANRKDAFTEGELQDIRSAWLQFAVDCFRQCGNIIRENSETLSRSLTISQ